MTTSPNAQMFCLWFLVLPVLICSANAQDTDQFRTKRIFGEEKSISIPDPYKESAEEFEDIANILVREFEEELGILYERERISRRIVPELQVDTIHRDGKPAIRAEYSYSVLDTLRYETDDFGLGQYLVSDSDALVTTLYLMRRGIDSHLEQYIVPGIEISFTITGSADAVPITGVIPYDGVYGDPIVQDCLLADGVQQMVVSSQNGISDNATLAFMRSYAVRNYIENQIDKLEKSSNTFFHEAVKSPYRGGEHRRVTIEMIIYDVFEDI